MTEDRQTWQDLQNDQEELSRGNVIVISDSQRSISLDGQTKDQNPGPLTDSHQHCLRGKNKRLVTRTQTDRHLRSSRYLSVCDAAEE